MSLWRIRYLLSSRLCDSRQVKTPSGAPCLTAVSYMIRTASKQQRHALGCGLKITELRVLIAMMHLNSTVDVGFVMGVSDRMTPIGSATSTSRRSGYSRMTPTVRL